MLKRLSLPWYWQTIVKALAHWFISCTFTRKSGRLRRASRHWRSILPLFCFEHRMRIGAKPSSSIWLTLTWLSRANSRQRESWMSLKWRHPQSSINSFVLIIARFSPSGWIMLFYPLSEDDSPKNTFWKYNKINTPIRGEIKNLFYRVQNVADSRRQPV